MWRTLSKQSLKNLGLCLFVSMIGSVGWAHAATTQYFESQEYGFSVELPSKWEQVPEDVLKSEIKLSGRRNIKAVFQAPGGEVWFAHPSVAIEFFPRVEQQGGAPITDEEFLSLVGQLMKKLNADSISSQLKNSTSLTQPMKDTVAKSLRVKGVSGPQIDLTRKTLWYELDTTVNGVPHYLWYGARVFSSGAAVAVAYSIKNDGSVESDAFFRQFHLSLRSLQSVRENSP